mgnify:CR=1 FL=1
MSNDKHIDVINLGLIARKIWAEKRKFFIAMPIVFILSCIYILGIPRTYETKAMLAPEMGSSLSGGTLGALASSFGFDLSDMETADAITPLLYPDLMEDNAFVAGLFDMAVESEDGSIKTTYYDYLLTKQQVSIWSMPIIWLKSLFKSNSQEGKGDTTFDPYHMTRKEHDIAENMRSSINLSIDKKTGVITIITKAQDPLICKTISDSVRSQLQMYITDYRTNKARTDYEYYKRLAADAKHDYEKSRQMYASMSDANSRIALRSVELKLEDMENDMQLKYNTYTTISTQLQAAKAKVQERTPAFTTIQGAAVPVKASAPKRMIFVMGMTVLAFFCMATWIVRKDLHLSF